MRNIIIEIPGENLAFTENLHKIMEKKGHVDLKLSLIVYETNIARASIMHPFIGLTSIKGTIIKAEILGNKKIKVKSEEV